MSGYTPPSPGSVTALFNNLQGNTHIYGGSFVVNSGNHDEKQTTGFENGLLTHHFIPSATHDTSDVPNPPQCHPGTRTAFLRDVSDWVQETESFTRIFWLFGPAGAGKSAIAHSVAENLSASGTLVASFFFCRMDARRNSDKQFVATIVYQIARHRLLRQYISAAIMDDPTIFCRSIKTQFERLVVGPVSKVYSHFALPPVLVIVDGLDECEDREGRRLILDTIFHALPRLGTSFKFLISSRPESDIRRSFEGSGVRKEIKFAELLSDFQAHEDIRLYLCHGFSHLKMTHPIGETLGSGWPPNGAIEALVHRSAGNFIYASIILRYIDSPRDRPQDCLNAVLSLRTTTQENPYSELDAIYHEILASSRADRERLSEVLALSMVCINANEPLATLDLFIESLLAWERGSVKLLFLDLSSLISLRKSSWSLQFPLWWIKFEHKSFVDFLLDASRSGEFFVDLRRACTTAAKACLRALNDGTYLAKFWPNAVDMGTVQKCTVDKFVKVAYQRVLTWCCRRALPDPGLQSQLLDHDVLKPLPPGSILYGKSFDMYLDFLDAIKEGSACQGTKVFQRHLSLFDKYLNYELDYWVMVQPRLMILLSMFISRRGIEWAKLIESQPRASFKSIMQPSLDYACQSPGLCLPHFFMWFLDGRIASFASSSDVLSRFVSDFFHSEERAGKYYVGRKDYRWLTI